MAQLTLREAAEAVGVSKSTLFRAIRAGRVSATRDADGQFQVDPAELFRVYEPVGKERNGPARVEAQSAERDAPPHDTALQVRCASLEAEVAGLKQMVEELRRSREKWEAQAERLTLALPPPSPPAQEARQAAGGGRWQAFWRRAVEGAARSRNGCTRPAEPP